MPYLAHATMEPMTAVALFEDGKLTLWTGTQIPTVIRDSAAKLADIDAQDVTVHTTFMGGGFGRRSETDAADQATRLALARPDTPIKLTWSREEDMRHDFYRPGAIARMRGVMGTTGPTAFSADIAAPSVYRARAARLTGIVPRGPTRSSSRERSTNPMGSRTTACAVLSPTSRSRSGRGARSATHTMRFSMNVLSTSWPLRPASIRSRCGCN